MMLFASNISVEEIATSLREMVFMPEYSIKNVSDDEFNYLEAGPQNHNEDVYYSTYEKIMERIVIHDFYKTGHDYFLYHDPKNDLYLVPVGAEWNEANQTYVKD